MNCNDVSAILDTHRSTRLSAAERATVDGHLTGCEDCAAAWHAQLELLGLPVPRMPATLLERALAAAHVPRNAVPRAEARRAWPTIAVGTALLAGAALASVTIVSLTRSPSVTVPSATGGEPSAQVDDTHDVSAPAAAAATTAANESQTAATTSVDLVETALSVVPIVRRNPVYPLELMTERVEGHVQVKFDITAAGTVENVTVVESSDARFEAPAVEAVAGWRYLPRIAAGKRAASQGIRTVIRFALGKTTAPPDPRRDEQQAEAQRLYLSFSSGLGVALQRLVDDDFRGAELQLDEMQAFYTADSFHADLWKFYGYLYTLQGNFDRAIDSYETALAAARRTASPAGPWVPLANLYFARHQYDMALKTLTNYRERVEAVQAASPGRPPWAPEPEALRLVEQLRTLGVNVDALTVP